MIGELILLFSSWPFTPLYIYDTNLPRRLPPSGKPTSWTYHFSKCFVRQKIISYFSRWGVHLLMELFHIAGQDLHHMRGVLTTCMGVFNLYSKLILLVLCVLVCTNYPGGNALIKVTGVIIRKFKKNVAAFCFVGAVRTIYLPLRGTSSYQLTDIYFLSHFSAQYPNWYHY